MTETEQKSRVFDFKKNPCIFIVLSLWCGIWSCKFPCFKISFNFDNFIITIFSFLKGDMFIVHNELEDGWMWVTNLRTDEQGLIVEDLVEEVVSFIFSSS